jgi:hypothetical protein
MPAVQEIKSILIAFIKNLKIVQQKPISGLANSIRPFRETTVYKEKTSGRISLQPCQEGASEADLKLFSFCFQAVVL